MAQLRHDHENFLAQDLEIVIIGPENDKAFSEYWKSHKLPFIGLPDPKHTVLKLYGQEVSLFKLGRMPAQVMIDKNGIVRFVHYGRDMSDIPGNDEILRLLKSLNGEVYVSN